MNEYSFIIFIIILSKFDVKRVNKRKTPEIYSGVFNKIKKLG